MRVLAKSCPNANCPQVLDPEDGKNLLVQGYIKTMATPVGEGVVEVPIEDILTAADNYRASQRA